MIILIIKNINLNIIANDNNNYCNAIKCDNHNNNIHNGNNNINNSNINNNNDCNNTCIIFVIIIII